MWPWTTNSHKVYTTIENLESEVQKNLNIEKMAFKVLQWNS